jgi:hypothetical protein
VPQPFRCPQLPHRTNFRKTTAPLGAVDLDSAGFKAMTSLHYTVEAEWQATPRIRDRVRRLIVAREFRDPHQFDAEALTAALGLKPKPLPPGVARRIRGNYAPSIDCPRARMKRRIGALAIA